MKKNNCYDNLSKEDLELIANLTDLQTKIENEKIDSVLRFVSKAQIFNNTSNKKILDKIPSAEEYPAINKWLYSSDFLIEDIIKFYDGGIFCFSLYFMWIFDLAEDGIWVFNNENVFKLMKLLEDKIFADMFQEVFKNDIDCFWVR